LVELVLATENDAPSRFLFWVPPSAPAENVTPAKAPDATPPGTTPPPTEGVPAAGVPPSPVPGKPPVKGPVKR
jgi:hypothetical protein